MIDTNKDTELTTLLRCSIDRPDDAVAELASDGRIVALHQFNPTHWPLRPTRLSIAVRLGITRMLLESRT